MRDDFHGHEISGVVSQRDTAVQHFDSKPNWWKLAGLPSHGTWPCPPQPPFIPDLMLLLEIADIAPVRDLCLRLMRF